jgi:hypothetical protein
MYKSCAISNPPLYHMYSKSSHICLRSDESWPLGLVS